jgi:hypothetical protein
LDSISPAPITFADLIASSVESESASDYIRQQKP